MKRDELDRAFGPTPEAFTRKIDDALQNLKEDRPVKRLTFRTAIIAVLIALLLCGAAYAIIAMQGQEWYYDNRFTAYQEHEPEKHQAIIEHLQTEVPQAESRDEKGLVDVAVQDYSWAAEQDVFTLSLAARATDDARYELYSLYALDTDGACTDEIDPLDPESRTEHWLWTKKGHGLPKDVMEDPSKQLLLIRIGDMDVLVGDSDVRMPMYSYDDFIGEDGACVAVLEFDLAQLDAEAVRRRYAEMKPYEGVIPSEVGSYETLRPGDAGDAVKRLQQRLSDLGYYNGHIDGVYEDETALCLASFQRRNFLANDGIAGPVTQARLYADNAVNAYDEGEPEFSQTLDEWTAQTREAFEYALNMAETVSAEIEKATDEDGMLKLRMPYEVYPFADGKIGESTEGVAVFKVRIR